MGMPQVKPRISVNRSEVADTSSKRDAVSRHIFDKMDRAYGMASPADTKYCRQVFDPMSIDEGGRVLLPANEGETNVPTDYNSMDRKAGIVVTSENSLTMTAGTAGVAYCIFDPVRSGFNNQASGFVTGATYAGVATGNIPDTTTTGLTTFPLTPSSPYAGPLGTSRNRFSVCLGLTVEVTVNSESAMNRQGIIRVSRVGQIGSGINTDNFPGTLTYDAAMLEVGSGPMIVVSPETASTVNNPNLAELSTTSIATARRGLYVIKVSGATAGDEFVLTIRSAYFLFGFGFPANTVPVFSPSYWCALNCWNDQFGLTCAVVAKELKATTKVVMKRAEAHTIQHTSGGFWSRALPWLGENVPKILGGISTLLPLL